MSEESKPMTNKPNILMIVTDQEYAHQPMPAEFALPSRDRIRARGVTFNHHHCTTTVCTPSRSVMLTGRHTPHTRMFDNTNFAWIDDMKADPKALPTIGHMLRDLGYHTVLKASGTSPSFQRRVPVKRWNPTASPSTRIGAMCKAGRWMGL